MDLHNLYKILIPVLSAQQNHKTPRPYPAYIPRFELIYHQRCLHIELQKERHQGQKAMVRWVPIVSNGSAVYHWDHPFLLLIIRWRLPDNGSEP